MTKGRALHSNSVVEEANNHRALAKKTSKIMEKWARRNYPNRKWY